MKEIEFQNTKFYKHPNYKKYFVSKDGKILSLKRKERKILKLAVDCGGYLYFTLCENNKKRNYYIHR